VIAVLDTNVDPSGIAFPVPGNDDASRAVRLYCDAVARAASKGGNEAVADSGVDVGAMEAPPAEEAVEAPAEVAADMPAEIADAPAEADPDTTAEGPVGETGEEASA
jgi:small subunit ribosomal protein S2